MHSGKPSLQGPGATEQGTCGAEAGGRLRPEQSVRAACRQEPLSQPEPRWSHSSAEGAASVTSLMPLSLVKSQSHLTLRPHGL